MNSVADIQDQEWIIPGPVSEFFFKLTKSSNGCVGCSTSEYSQIKVFFSVI